MTHQLPWWHFCTSRVWLQQSMSDCPQQSHNLLTTSDNCASMFSVTKTTASVSLISMSTRPTTILPSPLTQDALYDDCVMIFKRLKRHAYILMILYCRNSQQCPACTKTKCVLLDALQKKEPRNADRVRGRREGGLDLGQFRDLVTCPITHEVMTDPVTLETGITYERSAISQWLSCNESCPITNTALHSRRLHPNILARQLLSDMGLP